MAKLLYKPSPRPSFFSVTSQAAGWAPWYIMNKLKKLIIEKFLPAAARWGFVVEVDRYKRELERMQDRLKYAEEERDQAQHYAECLRSEMRGVQRALNQKIVIKPDWVAKKRCQCQNIAEGNNATEPRQ